MSLSGLWSPPVTRRAGPRDQEGLGGAELRTQGSHGLLRLCRGKEVRLLCSHGRQTGPIGLWPGSRAWQHQTGLEGGDNRPGLQWAQWRWCWPGPRQGGCTASAPMCRWVTEQGAVTMPHRDPSNGASGGPDVPPISRWGLTALSSVGRGGGQSLQWDPYHVLVSDRNKVSQPSLTGEYRWHILAQQMAHSPGTRGIKGPGRLNRCPGAGSQQNTTPELQYKSRDYQPMHCPLGDTGCSTDGCSPLGGRTTGRQGSMPT